jgi:F0F1-type ATP synthase assembly protein I
MSTQLPQNEKKPNESLRNYAKYSGIGFQMIVIIGFFAWAGVKLDDWLKTATPWFTILGCLIGVGAAMYNIIRQLK